jgi:nitrogen regulatory protein P-II 2
MKWITAVIQPHRLESVKLALTEAEIFRLTVSDVQGYGRQKGHTEFFQGEPSQTNLIRKVRLDIAVDDGQVQTTIDAITRAARTGSGGRGQVGDGKIFVLPIDRAIRISDGASGTEAL